MSGGTFEYQQYQIQDIARQIKAHLKEMGQPIPKDELYMNEQFYKDYPEELLNLDYSAETKQEFRNAIDILELAYLYTQRIDYLLAADDGEETFHKRLKKELEAL